MDLQELVTEIKHMPFDSYHWVRLAYKFQENNASSPFRIRLAFLPTSSTLVRARSNSLIEDYRFGTQVLRVDRGANLPKMDVMGTSCKVLVESRQSPAERLLPTKWPDFNDIILTRFQGEMYELQIEPEDVYWFNRLTGKRFKPYSKISVGLADENVKLRFVEWLDAIAKHGHLQPERENDERIDNEKTSTKAATAQELMEAEVDANPASAEWSKRQWAKAIGKSGTAVVKTQMWRTLAAARTKRDAKVDHLRELKKRQFDADR